jgi:hypothetical protein
MFTDRRWFTGPDFTITHGTDRIIIRDL